MLIGAFGIVIMTTPPPTAEEPEAPYTLNAITYAYTLDPQAKLKGSAFRDAVGIEHCAFCTIIAKAPLQWLIFCKYTVLLDVCIHI